VAWRLDCAAVGGLEQGRRMLRFGTCAAGPAHAESGSACGSTKRGSSLRLAVGSPGVNQAALVGPRPPYKKTNASTYQPPASQVVGPAVAGSHRRLPCGRWSDDAARVAVCSGIARADAAVEVVSAALGRAAVVNMSDYGRFRGPRFAQLDDDYKVWAAYQLAQLKKEKLWPAVVTDRPAVGSDVKKSDPVVEAWDAMSEAALATIQMSVKPVHLNTVTSIDTEKEAWDARKVMFEARDNAQLLRLMDELSSVKKGEDENIIKFASCAKMIRDELAMLGNPVDDNTLALRVLLGLPAEYGMLRTGCSGWSWRTRTPSSSCRT